MSEQRIDQPAGKRRHEVIQRVLRRGGWIRDTLYAQGQHPDTAAWQNTSGTQIAAELLVRISVVGVPSNTAADVAARQQFVQDALDALQPASNSYGVIVPYAGTESEADRAKCVTYISFRADLPA